MGRTQKRRIMKNLLLALVAFGMTGSVALAGRPSPTPIPQPNPRMAKVKELAAKQLGEDVRTELTYVESANICGAEGPAYFVELQVKHWRKTFCGNNGVCLTPEW